MKSNKGFTLIELAIVFLVIAALLSFTLVPLRSQMETANIKEARAKLVEIEEALYGFAIANNRMPCPASPNSNGLENPENPAEHCNDDAAIDGYIGFVPAATLGIKGEVNCDGLLIDPWGRPYMYSVTNYNDPDGTLDQGVFVVPGGISTAANFGPPPANLPANVQPNLRVCNDLTAACPGGSTSVTNAVAVIFSMGSREHANSAREDENAGETIAASTCGLGDYDKGNDNNYYMAQRIEQGANEFDDILIWISPNILYAKLLQAGHALQ